MQPYDQNASWTGTALFGLYFSIAVYQWRKSGQELKQGGIPEVEANAEVVEGSCLLADFPWLAQPTYL